MRRRGLVFELVEGGRMVGLLVAETAVDVALAACGRSRRWIALRHAVCCDCGLEGRDDRGG